VLGGGAVLVVAIVAAVVAVAWLGSGNSSPVAPTVGVAQVQGPPRGALVVAGESGSRAVALAVTPRRVRATVLAPSGDPQSGLTVSFRSGGKAVSAKPCGAGCYTAPLRAAGSVEVRQNGSPSITLRTPASARSGARIVSQAGRVIRGLRSLVYVESLRSSPKAGLVTTWKMAAPDRLSYRIHGGAGAVVIGSRRWDQARPGAHWDESSQTPVLQVPQPAWGSRFANAHVLGTTSVGGRPVWVVSFLNPTVPAWFTAWIDRQSYRTLRLRMTAASHFMFHRYLEFDGPVRIAPPPR
jgi:hypothetical protein